MSLKRMFKMAAFGTSMILTSPLIVAAWLEKKASTSEVVFTGASQLLALLPSFVGTYLRSAFYYGALERCSWEIHVGFGTIFTHRSASMGRNTSIGTYCVIGHADIGDQVMMASRVSIPSGRRQHFDDAGRLSAKTRYDRVAIGSKSWIGEGAIVMADLGDHCVVSAGAVVLKSKPPATLVGGNPARVLKELGPDVIDNMAD